jgi:hypothetical protein
MKSQAKTAQAHGVSEKTVQRQKKAEKLASDEELWPSRTPFPV